jgi:hypothetical protein
VTPSGCHKQALLFKPLLLRGQPNDVFYVDLTAAITSGNRRSVIPNPIAKIIAPVEPNGDTNFGNQLVRRNFQTPDSTIPND